LTKKEKKQDNYSPLLMSYTVCLLMLNRVSSYKTGMPGINVISGQY